MITIYADPNCTFCHGEGTVYDIVPYGSTSAYMPSTCECAFETLPNDIADRIDNGEEYDVAPAWENKNQMKGGDN